MAAATVACTPTVEPTGFDVDSVDWERVEAHVDVRAANPWPVDITIRAVHYEVRVDGTVVASGAAPEPQTVPARDTLTVALPVRIDTRSTLAALSTPASGATTGAVVSGAVTFDTPLGPVEVPLTYTESVPTLQEPTLRRPWVELRDVSLASGTLDLVVGCSVSNRNGLALDIRDVHYGVNLSGFPLISGEKRRAHLRAHDTTALELPVHLDASAVGRSLVHLIESGRFHGSAHLSGSVQTPWDPIVLDLRRAGQIRIWD